MKRQEKQRGARGKKKLNVRSETLYSAVSAPFDSVLQLRHARKTTESFTIRSRSAVSVNSRALEDGADPINSQSSTTLLASLEAFISTFQNDLSAVSGHIADLQSRSKVIEARLENRKVRSCRYTARKSS